MSKKVRQSPHSGVYAFRLKNVVDNGQLVEADALLRAGDPEIIIT